MNENIVTAYIWDDSESRKFIGEFDHFKLAKDAALANKKAYKVEIVQGNNCQVYDCNANNFRLSKSYYI
jgi:hypothetical protein